MPRIVAAAQSSTGSFYFDNKEDVFAAALASVGDDLSRRLNEATDDQKDPRPRMRAAVEEFFGS